MSYVVRRAYSRKAISSLRFARRTTATRWSDVCTDLIGTTAAHSSVSSRNSLASATYRATSLRELTMRNALNSAPSNTPSSVSIASSPVVPPGQCNHGEAFAVMPKMREPYAFSTHFGQAT